MKKIFVFFVAVSMIALFFGCKNESADDIRPERVKKEQTAMVQKKDCNPRARCFDKVEELQDVLKKDLVLMSKIQFDRGEKVMTFSIGGLGYESKLESKKDIDVKLSSALSLADYKDKYGDPRGLDNPPIDAVIYFGNDVEEFTNTLFFWMSKGIEVVCGSDKAKGFWII